MVNMPCRIELLGTLAVVRGGVRTERFRSRKTALLLGYLALRHGRPVPREVLADVLWPEDTQEAARNSLRVALNSLRHQLEPPTVKPGDVLGASRTDIWLVKESAAVDYEEFKEQLASAKRLGTSSSREELGNGIESGSPSPDEQARHERVERLLRALRLYQGELLEGLYGEWIDEPRREAQSMFADAAAEAADLLLELSRAKEALSIMSRLVALDDLDEECQRRLMRCYAALGQFAQARAAFEALRDRLRDELGIEPENETVALLEELPKFRQSASNPSPTANPVELHRPIGLPTPPSAFHGRRGELRKLSELLCPEPLRSSLITLTGLGGIGKTRLSLEAARVNADRFTGGCWFVPLAEIETGSHIGQAIADALRIRLSPHQVALEQVADELRTRPPSLLVLDNFEQLVQSGRQQVERLLANVPGLTVLVTSRTHLGLPGEREFRVDPLDVPGQDLSMVQMIESGGVALFVDRAHSAQPDFQLTDRNAPVVAELCRKLDGIPLAIELAAARVRVLSPVQMIEELERRFDLLVNRRAGEGFRHGSIRAVLERSVELLPIAAQKFFATLSVFRGSWNLDAARGVGGREALDSLDDLVGSSLVRVQATPSEKRYSMLETIREYASLLLTGEERMEAERRHARFFRSWSEANETTSFSRLREQVSAANDLDIDNLRSAWSWSMNNEPLWALEIAANLRWLYFLNGRLAEGAEMLTRSLQSAADAPQDKIAKGLVTLGAIQCWSDQFSAAMQSLSKALALLTPENRREWRLAISFAGWATMYEGDVEEAYKRLAEAARLSRDEGAAWSVGTCLNLMGFAACFAGRFEDARNLFEESYDILVGAGDSGTAAHSFIGLGRTAWLQENLDEAENHYRAGLAVFRNHRERRGEAYALEGLARVFSRRGNHAAAITLLAAAQSLRDRAALKRDPRDRQDCDAVMEAAQAALTAETLEEAWQKGMRHKSDAEESECESRAS